MQNGTAHFAILGGGLAGLSLALALRAQRVPAHLTIIEPREHYTDDRTWCFWDTDRHPFRDLIAQRWPRWRTRTPQRTATGESHHTPYCRLRAGAVYQRALDQLSGDPDVTLALGSHVTGICQGTVQTDRGALAPTAIFDGRPPPQRADWPGRMQQFLGRRLSFDRPSFEPGRCELMDFCLPQDLGIAFLYVLPEDRHTALIEATVLSAERVSQARLAALLETAIAERYGTPALVHGEENGAIPMLPHPPNEAPEGTIAIGTRAGAPRPSTGYAFLPIQRHSRALAQAAGRGRLAQQPMRSAFTSWLDKVFLTALANNPWQAPAYFLQLFGKVPSHRLARFLMERGGAVDHARVMAALPVRPFMQAALRGPQRLAAPSPVLSDVS